ncbi:TM0106 family RecB-like putative nuclease [Speluncibacter jeojiensis]|uniref:TM0106 family RecB-like putative nuclease n=1 Tax=Speluncibacter jeojiensis TaxID=2710754 RepID=A0A9X4LXT0_9ACTN|nr:TM0106 family RecB-like putative nuclease [Rhodococcus sp. D2-41]MDG3014274.1 TM0106 family RecB-like putative nuclease [Corynebacteriales bacterium D3-21]
MFVNSPSRPPILLDAGALTRCRHRIRRDVVAGPQASAQPVSPGVRQRQEGAQAQRERVRERLRSQWPGTWRTVDASARADERARETLQACAEGIDRIWGAWLPAEPDVGRRGGVELLVRDEQRGGYLPVIVVNHKVTDPGRGATTSPLDSWQPAADESHKVRSQPRDHVRLAHVTRMMQRAGIASPALLGGAIGFDADCVLVTDLSGDDGILAQYDRRFEDRIAVARGEVPTEPSRISECAHCPWWPDCEQVLLARHDVSLVVRGAQSEALRSAGVTTIEQLANWIGDAPDDWPGNGFADAVICAKAWLAGVPLVRRFDAVSVARADVEVDVDMESYQEHGAYLWGTLTTIDGVDHGYRPFVTWDPLPTTDEARSFAQFWEWLMDVRATAAADGKTFAAYCYSKMAENRWLIGSAQRFAGMPGIPALAEVQAFIASPQWVDVYEAVSSQFVCPNGKGLKKIAPIAGFSWRDAEAGGEASMGWYREAVGYDGAPDLTQRERLLEYNEDDVLATRMLRQWMSERAVAEVPGHGDLDAAAASSGTLTEGAAETLF